MFAQRRNRLTTHFSERIPVDKRRISVIRRIRFANWITKARTHTHTHSKYEIPFALPLQKWLWERASVLRYTHIACLVVACSDTVLPQSDKQNNADQNFQTLRLEVTRRVCLKLWLVIFKVIRIMCNQWPKYDACCLPHSFQFIIHLSSWRRISSASDVITIKSHRWSIQVRVCDTPFKYYKSWSFSRLQNSVNFSPTGNSVKIWRFSDVSGADSVPIFRVCWWFVSTETDD
jgi:hypothetical protein